MERGHNPFQKVVLIDVANHTVVADPAPFEVPGCAYGVAYDPDGTLWVSDQDNAAVYIYTTAGANIHSYFTGDGSIYPPYPPPNGNNSDYFSGYPNSGILASCGKIYVSNYEGGEIYEVPSDFGASQVPPYSSPPPQFYLNGSA